MAAKNRYKCVGVLGTRVPMEGPVYRSAFDACGIIYRIPEIEERREIDRCIFEELVVGKFTAEARNYFVRVVEGLRDRGFVKSYYGVYDERAKSNAEYQPNSQHKGWFGEQPFH